MTIWVTYGKGPRMSEFVHVGDSRRSRGSLHREIVDGGGPGPALSSGPALCASGTAFRVASIDTGCHLLWTKPDSMGLDAHRGRRPDEAVTRLRILIVAHEPVRRAGSLF